MTNFKYARRIAEAARLDLDLDCEEIDLQDKFYGLFQVISENLRCGVIDHHYPAFVSGMDAVEPVRAQWIVT